MTTRVTRTKRRLLLLAGMLVVAATGTAVVLPHDSQPKTPVDRAATWLKATDNCPILARFLSPLPAEAYSVAPDIPAATKRARLFTGLECRTLRSSRSRASVWTFATLQARDAAVRHVHDRRLRAELCRVGDSIILMEAAYRRDSWRAFCAAVHGRLA